MPETITVEQGQSVASIAFQYGLHEDYVWNFADNAVLKQKRKDPNILFPGDQLVIPDKRVTPVSKPAGARHKFQRKGVPIKFQLRLLSGGKPRNGLKYRLAIDGSNVGEGTTDGEGWIRQPLSPDACSARLTLLPDGQPPETHTLVLSGLDPIDTVSGAQSRLANLGYYTGESSGELDDATVAAVSGFQKGLGLPATGQLDDATLSKLKELHKS